MRISDWSSDVCSSDLIAGTTRDLLHETVRIDGVELTLVDTAGLREPGDMIEREGMRRARAELERADIALVVLDARDPDAGRVELEAAVAGVPTPLWPDRKSTRLNSSHQCAYCTPSVACTKQKL